MKCAHANVAPEVCDQTLGVICLDCNKLLAYCWAENHVPESLWNRACKNDPECVPCVNDRYDVCSLCAETIILTQDNES